MVNKLIKQALWIAVIATIIDQLYHIIREYSHQIFDIANPETAYYIGLKFLFVFVVSWIVLKQFRLNIVQASVVIGIITAFLFSLVINYMFPYVYGLDIHMLHGAGIFLAVWITLKYKLGGKTK